MFYIFYTVSETGFPASSSGFNDNYIVTSNIRLLLNPVTFIEFYSSKWDTTSCSFTGDPYHEYLECKFIDIIDQDQVSHIVHPYPLL